MKATPVASRQVTAHNDATDSGNPMHVDETARAMNFKAALVPGVTVFGYMTHAPVSYFGAAWLERGCMQVRFRRPVYAGDSLSVESELRDATSDAPVLDVRVRNPEGEVCVLGGGAISANAGAVSAIPQTPIAVHRQLPDPAWPAERARFAAEKVLGSIDAQFDAAEADRFLDEMQDHHDMYRRGVTHPAWLLRQANLIVDWNFDMGPWIHVESEIQNYAPARNGERLEVRAQVIDLFDKKGHEYADLDIALLADGDPERLLMRVMHRAIYKMGGR